MQSCGFVYLRPPHNRLAKKSRMAPHLFLPMLAETVLLFVQPLPVLVYSLVVPIIDGLSEPSDIECHFSPGALVMHTMLFIGVVATTLVYMTFGELEAYHIKQTQFQKIAKRAFARLLGHNDTRRAFVLFLSFALQTFLTVFFSLFLGPEPLSCWMSVHTEDFMAFEFTRATVNATTGACLFLVTFVMVTYGRTAGMNAPMRGSPMAEEEVRKLADIRV
jgi:hypothetical protein